MIVVYAIGIWEGGGLAYLDWLSKIYFTRRTVYILDRRIKSSFRVPPGSSCYYFASNIVGRICVFLFRHLFLYPRFVFCLRDTNSEYFLNGIPSLSRPFFVQSKVFTLLQNRLLFDLRVINEFSCLYRLKLLLQRNWLIFTTRRSDTLLVQTSSMRRSISSFFTSPPLFSLLPTSIEPPVYTSTPRIYFSPNKSPATSPLRLFYPASSIIHKNHSRAFHALNLVRSCYGPVITMYCTIDERSLSSYSLHEGSVVALGSMTRAEVFDFYRYSDYLFFPSLCESLGLPLVEAAQLKLPIVASDLDFVHESCNPVSVFNPYSVLSIASSLSSLLDPGFI